MRIKTKIISLVMLVFVVSNTLTNITHAETLKIALLETPYNEIPLNPSSFSEYEKAYLAGIEVATHVAKRYNINIQFKPFFYGNGSLDVLGEVRKIQEWGADLVIGPSSSDQFMLLKNYFLDRMVISSYASGEMLKNLPKNFYSVFLTDNSVMMLLSRYIDKKFPQKNIYIISLADCKQCIDASQLFKKKLQSFNTEKKIIEKKTIIENIDFVDSKKLMDGHENDVILILNNTFYSYKLLIEHITANIPNKHMIFFSDEDNWGSEMSNIYNKKEMNYESYRIGPLLTNSTNPNYQKFSKAYFKIYHVKPTDAISYMTYITTISAIEALNKYPSQNKNENMRNKLLHSYLKALAHNSEWFKVKDYGVYLLTPHGEVLDKKTILN